eukprot:25736-Prorocentrum_minimum.AAC.2
MMTTLPVFAGLRLLRARGDRFQGPHCARHAPHGDVCDVQLPDLLLPALQRHRRVHAEVASGVRGLPAASWRVLGGGLRGGACV